MNIAILFADLNHRIIETAKTAIPEPDFLVEMRVDAMYDPQLVLSAAKIADDLDLTSDQAMAMLVMLVGMRRQHQAGRLRQLFSRTERKWIDYHRKMIESTCHIIDPIPMEKREAFTLKLTEAL